MSENEVITLKEIVKEVRDGQKELLQAFNDLRIEVVEKYTTKEESKLICQDIKDIKERKLNFYLSITAAGLAAFSIIIGILLK